MKNKISSIVILIILSGCFLTPHVISDSSFGNDWFYYPLGDKAWTFEDGVTTGWTTNRAGCLSSSVYADSPYSWYTSGGGEYTMDYVVNNDHALYAIRGKTVQFSFWFYPATTASDGSQNQARAEIYYEYYTGGGGGGCPYLLTFSDMQYLLDNNLMPNSEFSIGDVVDYYLIQQSLKPDTEGLYKLQLSEFEEEHDFFDQVRLLAVDHPRNVSVGVSPYGEILTYTSPYPPVSAITNEHKNVKHLLSSIDGEYYEGDKGSYVTLNFGDELNVSDGVKLVIRSDALLKSPVYVQTMNFAGKWQTVATIYTRTHWSTDIIDMSEYLPDAKGNLKVRLYFTSNDKIDFVGLDTSPQVAINVQEGELVSAFHSTEGDVKSKLQFSDDIYAELLPCNHIEVAYTIPKVSGDLSRNFIFVSKGRYEHLPAGILIDPWVYGVWVCPVESKWHSASVIATLPSTTTKVMVRIHGKPDFHAYIDHATLTIVDSIKNTFTYGTITLGTAVNTWKLETNEPRGHIEFVPAIHAEAASGYGIIAFQLTIELLPTPGTSTPQNGRLMIHYCEQGNPPGYEVDPAAIEANQLRLLEIGGYVISIGTGIAAGIGVPILLGAVGVAKDSFLAVFAKSTASTVIASQAKYWVRMIRSDPNVQDTQEAGTRYVTEYWGDYPTYSSEYHPTPFVYSVDGSANVEWRFNRASANAFRIKITASVWWGEENYYPGHYDGSHWELDGIGWTHAVLYMTVTL